MPVTTSDLIHFFVERVPGAGRTQIVKFLYLADLEARRHCGRPLSPLDYILYDYGPFDSNILACLDRMENQGIIRRQPATYLGKTAQRYYSQKALDPNPWDGSAQAILDYVVQTYGNMSLESLLDYVYHTKPVVDAKEKDAVELNMELVNNEAVVPGLELSRVIQAVAALDAGKGVSHKQVFARLHSAHP